eukprot:CAMPEP_0115213764 /NCGR_PEP_ID=MMETSP0270-20121206/23961_1 /TAXON_ID=71861 /ORGANISM="Scrippsiella trochoidea, Strain CCMP3099" /LENGTH=376 /DNA_ID=CAMNT_0002627521 /DNA_START=42 /DNA_END=1172 /DNA_ORIENTATION=+
MAWRPLNLRRGRRTHQLFSVLVAILGFSVIIMGSIAIYLRTPTSSCGPDADHLVTISASDAQSSDSTLIALGAPAIASGIILVLWGLQGLMDVVLLRRGRRVPAKPFMRGSTIIFVLAAIGLWLSAFISVAVASVLEELCQDYRCDAAQQADGLMHEGGLACLGVDDRWQRSCWDPSVCCMCKSAFESQLQAAFICRDTRDWACNLRSKRDAASFTFVLVASTVSGLAAVFGCSAAPACSAIMDVTDEPIAYTHSPPPSDLPEPQAVGPSQVSDAETMPDGEDDAADPSGQVSPGTGVGEGAKFETPKASVSPHADASSDDQAPESDNQQRIDDEEVPREAHLDAAQPSSALVSANRASQAACHDTYHTEIMSASC